MLCEYETVSANCNKPESARTVSYNIKPNSCDSASLIDGRKIVFELRGTGVTVKLMTINEFRSGAQQSLLCVFLCSATEHQ